MKVLLQGGHFHNRVVDVLNGISLLYMPIPEEIDHSFKEQDDLPMVIPTLKTERYMNTGYIGYPLGSSVAIPVWIVAND